MAYSTQYSICAEATPGPVGVSVPLVRQLAHELRQPLSAIESAAYYLDLVLEDADPRVRLQVEKIQRMVCLMGNILSDAVHYLEPARGNIDPVDLAAVAAAALNRESVLGQAEVNWDQPPEPVPVLMDLRQAQHLMASTLAVFQHMAPPERPVFLSLCREAGEVVLESACEVSAPPCENIDHLFQPFSPHMPPGMGLTLACIRRIAELNGGIASLSFTGGRMRLRVTLPAA